MVKKWITGALALALCTGSIAPLIGEETRNSGRQIVTQVEASYQKGDYDIFLTQLHEQYQRAGKAGVLRGVFESAKIAMPPSNTAEEDRKRYQGQMAQLDQERNHRLMEAITENRSLSIAHKVTSITTYSLPQEHAETLAELEALKYHIPETDEPTIKNKMSTLETEYYIKSLLLEIASRTSGSSPEEVNQKKIALVFQKFDEMEVVAKDSDDKIWVKKIQIAREAYRADKAYKMDLSVLNELAVGRTDPENGLEEKVKGIMIDFLSQRSAYEDQHLAELAQK